jgi:tripartite-type tricarboxylate transporter receptor subunit TctC
MKASRFLLLWLFSCAALAQDYPARQVRVLVGYPPGGGMDTITRVVMPKLADALGQPFIVENRPGASGGVAAEALVKSAPDGYVLMVAESGTLALPAVSPKVSLDPVRQFAPVGGICTLPMAFVVNTDVPFRTTQEMIAALKAKPGKYSYGSPGIGTLQHLAFEQFRRAAGVEALHVPYKGASAMLPDLMGGQIHIAVVSALAAQGPSRSGKIRILAVTSPQRLPNSPELPAMAETLPGFNAAPSVFLVAPAGTPGPVVQRLSSALRAALASRDIEENFAKQGATAAPGTPQELGTLIAEETRRWAAVVKDAGIKVD